MLGTRTMGKAMQSNNASFVQQGTRLIIRLFLFHLSLSHLCSPFNASLLVKLTTFFFLMVGSDCPKIVAMQDAFFSELHKPGSPLALCMHLKEIKLSLPDNQSQDFPDVSVASKPRKWSRARKRRGKKEGGLS